MTLYRQCRGSEDNAQLARSFIYYLEVNSLADEWFKELPEEDRKSWALIVVLFQRKWLNKEISIKWPTTPKNEPQPAPTILQIITEDLYYETNPLKTPKVNTEHDKSQDVTATPSTTTINQLDLKPPHSPNPTQNPCPNTPELPPAAPRVFMNPQTSQKMPKDGSTTFKKINQVIHNPQPPSTENMAPDDNETTYKDAQTPTSSPGTLHVINNIFKANTNGNEPQEQPNDAKMLVSPCSIALGHSNNASHKNEAETTEKHLVSLPAPPCLSTQSQMSAPTATLSPVTYCSPTSINQTTPVTSHPQLVTWIYNKPSTVAKDNNRLQAVPEGPVTMKMAPHIVVWPSHHSQALHPPPVPPGRHVLSVPALLYLFFTLDTSCTSTSPL